jgi:hypothetical protein
MENIQQNYEGKPMVRLCAYCENINAPNMAKFAVGVDPQVKKELATVHEKVQETSKEGKIAFSHGSCLLHTIQNYEQFPGITKEKLEQIAAEIKEKNTAAPDLIHNDTLRHAYMRGLFTVEQMKQAQQQLQQQQANKNQQNRLSERLKSLAGIKS